MMVAFQVRQRRRRLALLLARGAVAAAGAAAVEAVRPRRHHHVRVATAPSCWRAARAGRGCSSRAFATSAATRRCIATSLGAIRDGRHPEMSLERAMEDQRLMDQIYASLDRPPRHGADARRSHYDLVIIGTGAGGGTMAHALAGTGARILVVERGDVRAARGRRTGARTRSGRTCATARPSAGSTSAARRSCRTRTTASAATRSSGAACSTGCAARTSGGRARRRRLAGLADRLRDAGARTTTAPSGCITCTASVGDDPTEPPRGAVSASADPARAAAWPRSSSSCARRGCTRRPAARPDRTRARRAAACCATPATRFRASCARRATPRSAACAPRSRHAERHAVDRRAGRSG